jgi:hypothetical protein
VRSRPTDRRDALGEAHGALQLGGIDDREVAGGVAAFTGIGSPLTTVKATGTRISPRDLHEIESFFHGHQATTVTIEMAPWLSEESKQILGEGGYSVAAPGECRGNDLGHFAFGPSTSRGRNTLARMA